MRKTLIFAACLMALGGVSAARAQISPFELMITWHSNGYVPRYFEGKSLPVRDSVIRASLTATNQGKIMDLSKERVNWYLDDNFIDGGVGVKSVAFQIPVTTDGSLDLRAEVPGLSNSLRTVVIPVVSPEVVIRSALPKNEFNTPSVKVEAHPFFFTGDPSHLTFDWSINGKAPDSSDDPSRLTINLAQGVSRGFSIYLGLLVRNAVSSLEEARQTLRLTFNP